MRYSIKIENKAYDVHVENASGGLAEVTVEGRKYSVAYKPEVGPEATPSPGLRPGATVPPAGYTPPARPVPMPAAAFLPAEGKAFVAAPIPGVILEIKVKVNETVQSGQVVAAMEAMKMANDLRSPIAGIVEEIRAGKGTEVAAGDVILVISPTDPIER